MNIYDTTLDLLKRGTVLTSNGDLALWAKALVYSARTRRCCSRSRVRAPVRPGSFLR
jgi:hypothetical protein